MSNLHLLEFISIKMVFAIISGVDIGQIITGFVF